MDQPRTLTQIFADRLLLVPDYQRGYAWDRKQWDELLDDLQLLPEGKEHYAGTLVLCPRPDRPALHDDEGVRHTSFDIVDGQQRITTLVLLLHAIRQQLLQLDPGDPVAAGIRRRFLCTTARRQPLHRLTLNRDTHEFFAEAILSGDADAPVQSALPATIRSHRLLREAVQHFAAHLSPARVRLGDAAFLRWLLDLYDKLAHRLLFSVYEVREEMEVGVLFEAMNNRGRPLTELEKVKNYLLFLAANLEQGRLLGQEVNRTFSLIFERLCAAGLAPTHEDRLLRAHWILSYDPDIKTWSGSTSVKRRFPRPQEPSQHAALLEQLRRYIESLKSAAIAYCDIYHPSGAQAHDSFPDPAQRREAARWTKKLLHLSALSSVVPLLVALRLRCGADGTTYTDGIRLCERFAFRVYRLLGKRASTGQPILYRLAYRLATGELAPQTVLSQLRDKIHAYCPEDDLRRAFHFMEGRRWFKNETWYEWSGLRYLLFEYEEHLAAQKKVPMHLSWRSEVGVAPHTIEHILPQTPTDPYWASRFDDQARKRHVHDLGNLCLTQDNGPLSNKPFPQKKGQVGQKGCYADSVLLQERELAALSDWDPVQLDKRRQALVEWAVRRWAIPPLQTELLRK